MHNWVSGGSGGQPSSQTCRMAHQSKSVCHETCGRTSLHGPAHDRASRLCAARRSAPSPCRDAKPADGVVLCGAPHPGLRPDWLAPGRPDHRRDSSPRHAGPLQWHRRAPHWRSPGRRRVQEASNCNPQATAHTPAHQPGHPSFFHARRHDWSPSGTNRQGRREIRGHAVRQQALSSVQDSFFAAMRLRSMLMRIPSPIESVTSAVPP